MDLLELDKKRVMHIDTSCKLYERKNTGIAYKMIRSNEHKGLCLSLKLKKELERDLKINRDYARIYAICIYLLIKDDLDKFDILVICGDEDIKLVKKYLNFLFSKDKTYYEKEIISVYELRKITGNKKLRSYANNISNSYRKRAFKSLIRKQEGIPLNVLPINYKILKEKWSEIEYNEKV